MSASCATDPPVPPPASMMTSRQLRGWLAALTARSTRPGNQTIRRLRGEGLPHMRLGSRTLLYPAAEVWAWLRARIVSVQAFPSLPQMTAPLPVRVTVTPIRPRRTSDSLKSSM